MRHGFSVRCLKNELPTVITAQVTDITHNSAVSGGNVTSDGGVYVTNRGVVWSTTANPTIENNEGIAQGSGTGAFVSYLYGLNPSTEYFLRAFATNIEGTVYGGEQNFTTSAFECGTSTEKDIDGNVYNTVLIGTQCWMKENLKTTTYKNGNSIPEVIDQYQWGDLYSDAYVWYDNDISWKDKYGALYNWFAVVHPEGLCPEGWHVPFFIEFQALADHIGGTATPYGNVLKSCRQEGSPLGGDCDTPDHPRWDPHFHYGTDNYGFSGLPGGIRSALTGFFQDIGITGSFWSLTQQQSLSSYRLLLRNNSGAIQISSQDMRNGFSVRCIKNGLPAVITAQVTGITHNSAVSGGNVTSDGGANTARGVVWSTTANPTIENNEGITSDGTGTGQFVSILSGLDPLTEYFVRAYATNSKGTVYGAEFDFTTNPPFECGTSTIPDMDGNVYNTVLIGTQCWMKENLKTTTYKNGTPIPNATPAGAWSTLTTGAYVWYDNDISWKDSYGALYNWYAVDDPNGLCPAGWHVPTINEWWALEGFINLAGDKLKSCRQVNSPLGGDCNTTVHPRWAEHNINYGTDDYDFSGLPGGYRWEDGYFWLVGSYGGWWSSTETSPSNAWFSLLDYSNGYVNVDNFNKRSGFSIRCLRLLTLITTQVTGITHNSAVSGGTVNDEFGANVTARGVVWSTTANPTIENNEGITSDGAGTGQFVSFLTGLNHSTVYFVRAYASISGGTAYGEELEFTTTPAVLPTVTTTPVTVIAHNFAVSGGNVTSDGGVNVTARGVVWSTTANPTIENNEGITSDGTGAGQFESILSGLDPLTEYFVRAYAINSEGTAYGEELSFITTSFACGTSPIADIDGNVYNTVLIGNQCWMKENLKTTTYKNGTPIPNVTNGTTWHNLTTDAYVWYDNDINWKDSYGAIYNWYAVNNQNGLCPEGWHVPSNTEWTALTTFIGGTSSPNSNKLKSCRQVNSPLGGDCNTSVHPRWAQDNTHYGTDDYGFSGLPGGIRDGNGPFIGVGNNGFGWSSTEYSSSSAWSRGLYYNSGTVGVWAYDKRNGFSVRCLKNELPTVITAQVTDITHNSAISGGNVTSDGGVYVTNHGVVWSTTANPTIENNEGITSDGTGTGQFVSYLSGLNHSTEYFVRAYASNSAGTAYGEELEFTTTPAVLPTVTTTPVTDITENSAVSGGNVTNDGGANVTARGVVWSTTANPTIENNEGNTSDGPGTGQFVSFLTGLNQSTEYFVRAYASNSAGTAYGEDLEFTTTPVILPTVNTIPVTVIAHNFAVSGGNVTSDGGANVTARGVVWSTTANPTIENNDGITSDGTGKGQFESFLSGLDPLTEYFVRAYAINSEGTAYGEELSFITTSFACGTSPIADIDGNVYNTVLIGTQCWMKENLKVGTMINGGQKQTNNGIIEKYCYNNNTANCDIYGGLYQWDEMMGYSATPGVQGICPPDWHIPTDDEWKILEGTVDSQYGVGHSIWNNDGLRGFDAGKNLKSTSGWSSGGNGTDLYGFGALPGGIPGHQWVVRLSRPNNGHWWSSSENSGTTLGPRA
jgi:uncharacterized protein (TIGR02145 family)